MDTGITKLNVGFSIGEYKININKYDVTTDDSFLFNKPISMFLDDSFDVSAFKVVYLHL